EEITAPHRDFGVNISVSADGEGPEPGAARNPGLTSGLGKLVENAVDFAVREVSVAATWTNGTVKVAIADDGPGYSPEVVDRLGDPYVTTRRADTEHGGLGLGIFIAKTLLERSG